MHTVSSSFFLSSDAQWSRCSYISDLVTARYQHDPSVTYTKQFITTSEPSAAVPLCNGIEELHWFLLDSAAKFQATYQGLHSLLGAELVLAVGLGEQSASLAPSIGPLCLSTCKDRDVVISVTAHIVMHLAYCTLQEK